MNWNEKRRRAARGKRKQKAMERETERQTEVACVLAERFGGIEVIVNEGEFL